MHKATTRFAGRLTITFALRPYKPGEEGGPVTEYALDIAKPYMRKKGWLNEEGKALVELHPEVTPAEPGASTFTMGWHLPGKGNSVGCRLCAGARS